jgi:hypothetical protein
MKGRNTKGKEIRFCFLRKILLLLSYTCTVHKDSGSTLKKAHCVSFTEICKLMNIAHTSFENKRKIKTTFCRPNTEFLTVGARGA